MNLPGIILAAGRSTRMGRDKALLPYGDTTFLGALTETFLETLDPVVVVVGHHATEVRAAVPVDERVCVAVNADYDRGMLSSLQTGIAALPAEAPGAVFTLVDHPGVRAETVARLVETFERERPLIVIPRYKGERGHPVVAARSVLDELAALPPDASPKTVIRSHRPETIFVDLDDPAIIQDIDEPGDYARFSGSEN